MYFKKQIMSISELVEMGFPRDEIEGWVHRSGFPVITTQGKGKYLIDTTQLESWLKKNKHIKKDVCLVAETSN